ncbi:PIN-like domain-containing protein [Micromonospora robiginosa]|uniref:PIN-like domain-containing protein n=1 Tax=Micromonospora robiginosa TaxID=2749844 RepID=A0A7L6BCG9_9ACTN|nr:PIN-like domain-containing protein [Micromonospora ferruginea]QLQ39644.1 PIN-like domain-containing protein [Micromonospora ferruginea]
MAGLFDGFEGYRVASEAESRQALTTALVAVDANVLLNLYRYNARTTADLLAIFEKLEDRLVVPYQAMREFHRNRLSAIGNPEHATGEARAALEKSRAAAVRALETWSKQLAIDDAELQRLHADVDEVFQRLRDAIASATPDRVHPSTPADADPVLSRLSTLLTGKVLGRPEDKVWNGLITEGNKRVDASIPPGYLDADKADQHPEGAAGDYLVYQQACHEAKTRDMDLIIVTNDEKEDWWWRRGPDMIGPRQEMTKEFFDSTGHQLFLMRASDLLNRSQALDVEVNPESARDADVNRPDLHDPGMWTAEAVDMLLQQLRGEGRRDLADVITAAASAGGTISRENIYTLCGYHEDRMLRGITRPTARITADLQAAKVLPPSVTPMMAPVYIDAGPLSAIRIPSEVVDILGPGTTPPTTAPDAETSGKYQPLADYLAALDIEATSMTFGEIEDILGDTLAPSARKHLPYWYSSQNSLCRAVAAAGFKARGVRTDSEVVEFVRHS